MSFEFNKLNLFQNKINTRPVKVYGETRVVFIDLGLFDSLVSFVVYAGVPIC